MGLAEFVCVVGVVVVSYQIHDDHDIRITILILIISIATNMLKPTTANNTLLYFHNNPPHPYILHITILLLPIHTEYMFPIASTKYL